MKILLTGGGTGGHITPILAVAHELKQLQPDTQVIYVGERHGKFDQLTEGHAAIDASYSVFAGKFRRYYGQSWLTRLFDIKTNLLNVRDVLYVAIGIVQAWFLLRKIHPDVVFLKGGYVGVPIGLAARMRHLPIITHDSDALPGLANRLAGRSASLHATALPAEYYPYSPEKVEPVGVLVEHTYKPVTNDMQAAYKQQLGLPAGAPLLLITGGSSGAERINSAIIKIIDSLLKNEPALQVIHQVGQGKADAYGDYQHERLKILEFMKPMYVYMGAADLVITRASGNTIAELGIQGKAAIVIPNPDLTGGHQLKNAKLLEQNQAAKVLYESDLYNNQDGLYAVVTELLNDETKRRKLALGLQVITITGAAQKLASLIINQAKTKNHETST